MSASVRQAVVPLYLLLCLLLGGSSQGVWSNLALQLAGIAIIAVALVRRPAEPLTTASRRLIALVGAVAVLGAAHLVPLPPQIWTQFPGRAFVAEGFEILGQRLPWLPISLAPYDTLATLLTLAPPIAVLLGMLRLEAYRPAWLVAAILVGTASGILLGVLQVGGSGPQSPWHLYPITNTGVATGFFANANHFALLMVAAIPFLAAMVARADSEEAAGPPNPALVALGATALILFLVGLFLNNSLAGIGLGAPVLAASGVLLFPARRPKRGIALAAAAGLLVAVIAVIAASAARFGSNDAQLSIESRRTVAVTSIAAAADFAPLGSGIGTYARTYLVYEHPDELSRTFVNHAHNDYLEIVVETGLAGILAMILFLAWWVREAWRCWSSPAADSFARAATISSAAILAHSLVDFPLRTAAVAALFATCLALIAQPRVPRPWFAGRDLRGARHLGVE